jgi:Holliday junction resolvasome RuvABC endonuclease subunit
MAAKLQQIFSELTHIIAEHRPEVVAIEDVFYAINVKSALKEFNFTAQRRFPGRLHRDT